MNAAPDDVLAAVLVRLHGLQRIRRVVEKLYERTAGNERVKASDLAAVVAKAMRRENSGWFRRELTEAMRMAGWRSVRPKNVRSWLGVRKRLDDGAETRKGTRR